MDKDSVIIDSCKKFSLEITGLAMSKNISPNVFMLSISQILISASITSKINKPNFLSMMSNMWETIETQLSEIDQKNEMD